MFASLLAMLAFAIPLQENPVDLNTVIHRAMDYVQKYEQDLGNLIATEDYVQNAQSRSTVSMGRFQTSSQKVQRRTSADFLIIQVGSDWNGLRKVNRVDGSKVNDKEPAFEQAFDGSPTGNFKRLKGMVEESTRYNIGDVLRQINLPTFALRIMRGKEASRFSFQKMGEDKVNGVPAWSVRFKENAEPTLVAGDLAGEKFLFSYGTLWIDPNDGRILKTEFEVENPFTQPQIRARIVVTYSAGRKIDMLVPTSMQEHYETDLSTIDCRADYSNFRRFEVEVKFDLAPPKP